jgi:preprotein translocase subunit YajC
MQNIILFIISILCVIIVWLVAVIYVIQKRGRENDKFTREMLDDALKRLDKYAISGGFTQAQIDDMHKRILTHFGKDLNDMQIITIMINWRNTYEQLGAEMEFIKTFIKERKW